MLKGIGKINLKNKKLVLLIVMLVILAVVLGMTGTITKIIDNIRKAEKIQEMTYKIYKVDYNEADAVITFEDENGINTITYEDNILYCNGNTKVAIDYKLKDLTTYNFKVKYTNNEEKDLSTLIDLYKTKETPIL